MNKPQIRFKGFEEEWQQHPFSSIVTRNSSLKYDEKVPCVEYEDINSKKGTLNKDLSKKVIHKTGQYFVSGDILFGKLRPYLGNNLLAYFEGIAVGDFWIYKNGLALTDFVYPFLYSKDYSKIANISSGSKMPRADWELLGNWNFSIPMDEIEQQKIGDYFKRIDEMIIEVEREINRLEKMKQASLQKMFPRPGQTTPEIRFGEFTESWKVTTLGDVADIYQPLTISQSELTVNGFPVYGANGLIGYYSSYNHEFSQIAITCRGNTCGTINFTPPKTWITGNAMVVNLDNADIYKEFIFFYLQSKDMSEIISGSGQPQITRKPIADFIVRLPNDKEQKAIGTYFRNLDSLLSAKRQKLVKLRNIKQACLDKMFVNTSEL